MYDYDMNRSGRTSKEADESSFFSPSAEIDIRIPHRASTRLSCLFHTVVEIVTVNVCVWNNRRYAHARIQKGGGTGGLDPPEICQRWSLAWMFDR